MKKKTVTRVIVWGVFFSLMVWVTNFTIVGYFLKRNYTYSNYNGTFRFDEVRLKAFGYDTRDSSYAYFLRNNAGMRDEELYRTFRLDPWRFWEWRDWVEHFDRFTLSYISERKIQRNRESEGLDNKD
ncbi:hypothetical protein H8B06_10445 [Sphingobacterium sp. DN00404]|uniref:Uncharacterized protein n=1 Tax=Sphingobacterium micropteri TaxID=2763501 RepID=A0ABR7YPP0_9SPHI|nr:hypothetical protein [Sphingobacterium micropteri]MBD1433247.1 hypothetical protein [Sphingobacterium micropteri]